MILANIEIPFMKQNLRRAYIALTNNMFPNIDKNKELMDGLIKKSKAIWENPEEGDVKDLYLVFNMQGIINQRGDTKTAPKGKR